MAKVVKSFSLTPEVLERLKEFTGDNPMGLSQSMVVNMLLGEALDARKRATPVVQRPAFTPVPKPGGKS